MGATVFMTPSRVFTAVLRRSLRLLGYELIQTRQAPERTFAGLRHVPFLQVLDIGANRGDFARYARRILKFQEMHCFEPLPGPYAELESAAASLSNDKTKIYAHNVALGEAAGDALINLHRDHSVSSSLLPTTPITGKLFPLTQAQEQCLIRVERLDDYVANRPIKLLSPLLMKMDVQGFEDRVIRGGKETLRQVDLLMLEINFEQLYANQATFKSLFELLDGLGLSYAGNLAQEYSAEGRIISGDCLFFSEAFRTILSA